MTILEQLARNRKVYTRVQGGTGNEAVYAGAALPSSQRPQSARRESPAEPVKMQPPPATVETASRQVYSLHSQESPARALTWPVEGTEKPESASPLSPIPEIRYPEPVEATASRTDEDPVDRLMERLEQEARTGSQLSGEEETR